ncbi:MAG: SDR family NAD(P)-dependent oxidoreductase [Bacteroidales bacterium]
MNPFSLEGKIIIITGASSGIGQQCAISCSQMGARVVLIARNALRLQETLNKMDNRGVHVVCPLDLTDYNKVSEVISEIAKKIGPFHGLINCAGMSSINLLDFTNIDKLNQIFSTNVFSSFLLTKEVCKKGRFSKEGGAIIFISSIMGIVGDSAKSLYSMTKGALISGVKSLACELAHKKIRVNCISPGAIITPINEDLSYITDHEERKLLEQKHLLGFGETTDIANACIFLLSDAARWVTGSNLIVDGGYTAK